MIAADLSDNQHERGCMPTLAAGLQVEDMTVACQDQEDPGQSSIEINHFTPKVEPSELHVGMRRTHHSELCLLYSAALTPLYSRPAVPPLAPGRTLYFENATRALVPHLVQGGPHLVHVSRESCAA